MSDAHGETKDTSVIRIDAEDPTASNESSMHDIKPRNAEGWDGKLRVGELLSGNRKEAVLSNPEALSDPEYSDPEQVVPGEVIDADEDLLEGYEEDTEDIDLVHCRIGSIPSLRLERFPKVQRLCLRQNQITSINLPTSIASSLRDLDLYDNLVSHLSSGHHDDVSTTKDEEEAYGGLDALSPENLRSLDLSFNKIKHIKNVSHLKALRDLYFVQNKISKIDGLEGLESLRMLELGGNRIRDITGLESLKSLEELWLGKNKIAEIKNISTLQSLKILSLPSNRITSLVDFPVLPELEELYLSHNMLTSLEGLSAAAESTADDEANAPSSTNTSRVPSLHVLDISSNAITTLSATDKATPSPLSACPHLEELWASDNKLSDFAEIERELSGKKELKTVYFEGNPLQTKGPAVYRNKIKLALPTVVQIDASMSPLVFSLAFLSICVFLIAGYDALGLDFVRLVWDSQSPSLRAVNVAQ